MNAAYTAQRPRPQRPPTPRRREPEPLLNHDRSSDGRRSRVRLREPPADGRDWFDVDYVADGYQAVPGTLIDSANKLMKPVTNYWTTYRRLWENVLEARSAARPTRLGRAGSPIAAFPAWAVSERITRMYKEMRLVRGRLRLGERPIDLSRIDQSLLIVAVGADHIVPPEGTHPLLELVSGQDITGPTDRVGTSG